MWYGIKKNGEITQVKWFSSRPTVFDFNCFLSSEMEIEIVRVSVVEI